MCCDCWLSSWWTQCKQSFALPQQTPCALSGLSQSLNSTGTLEYTINKMLLQRLNHLFPSFQYYMTVLYQKPHQMTLKAPPLQYKVCPFCLLNWRCSLNPKKVAYATICSCCLFPKQCLLLPMFPATGSCLRGLVFLWSLVHRDNISHQLQNCNSISTSSTKDHC